MSRYINCILAGLLLLVSNMQFANAGGKTRVGGFLRAGASISDSDTTYMDRIDSDGNYDDTHLGINVTRKINTRWSASAQLFGSGMENNYALMVESAYITFRAYEEASFNMGKMPYPNLIVSGHYNEGVKYLWIRPPEEVYRTDVLGPSLSYKTFSGIKINYVKTLKKFEFLFGLYGGGTTLENEKMSEMSGVVLSVGDDIFKIRAAYNQSTLNLGINSARDANIDNKKQIAKSVGVNFDFKYIVGYTEYVDAKVEDVDAVSTQAFYYTLGIRAGKFMPHYTVAEFKTDNEQGQKSIAYGIKYQANSFASFKMEYKIIEPSERQDLDLVNNPSGHFSSVPAEKEVSIFSMVVDVAF